LEAYTIGSPQPSLPWGADLLGWGSLETWLAAMAVGVQATPEFIADMSFEPILISIESAIA